jgi:hypothetical protein
MPPFGAALIRSIEARELKRARYVLLASGALQLLFSALFVSPWLEALVSASNESVGADNQFVRFLDHAHVVAEAGCVVGVTFAACAIIVRRVPLWSTATALVLHVALVISQVIAGAVRWSSPFWVTSWIIYASMITVGLARALTHARRRTCTE